MDSLILIFLGAIWGGSFLFMKLAAPSMGAINLVRWRMLFASAALLPFAWQATKVPRKDLHRLLVLALVTSAVPFTLLTYSSMHLSAGMASIMNATAPFFSALWGLLFFQTRLTARQNSGLALGFVGVWVLVSDKVSISTSGLESLLPYATGLLAAACYGFAANYGKRFLSHPDAKIVSFWNCFLAAIVLTPLSYAGPYPWHFGWLVIGSLLALGVLCTAIAYLIYFKLLVRSGATKALMVTFLIPLSAALWGWLFLSEVLTLKMVIGAAIVFWGIRRMMKE